MVKKMLTKEECKEAVSILKDQHEYLSFTLRANYPFSIEMIRKVQDCFEQLIKEYFNPQPYKFEDLNSDMWVWDNDIKEVIHIRSVVDDDLYFLSVGEEDVGYAEFEEGRFYPVTKALEYQK